MPTASGAAASAGDSASIAKRSASAAAPSASRLCWAVVVVRRMYCCSCCATAVFCALTRIFGSSSMTVIRRAPAVQMRRPQRIVPAPARTTTRVLVHGAASSPYLGMAAIAILLGVAAATIVLVVAVSHALPPSPNAGLDYLGADMRTPSAHVDRR